VRRQAERRIAAPVSDLATESRHRASLRKKAAELAVSHEAVRQAMRAAGLPTDLESRNRAIN
jgi:hypothetical protein